MVSSCLTISTPAGLGSGGGRGRRGGAGPAGRLALALGLVGALAAAPAGAEELVPDHWQFQLTPYLWAVAIDGDVTVKGQKSDVDMSFRDILKDLNFALFVSGEARKGRFGLLVDGVYSALESDEDGENVKVDATLDLAYLSAAASYRLGPFDLDAARGAAGPRLVVDPYLGGRYTYGNVDLKLKTRDPLAAASRKVGGDQTWLDPIVGVRTLWQLTPDWTVTVLGDVGGFGLSGDEDFAWQAAGLIGYRFGLFAEDDARVLAGYRALHQNYRDGDGRDEFEWDMTLHGPVLGLALTF
jgi:hypothetical protein